MRRLSLVVFLGVLFVASTALARTWYVKPDSTGDAPTIEAAVDSAAAQGDTIILADGTFTGEGNRDVDCLDKALTIISESGDPELCVIDCGCGFGCFDRRAGFYFRSSEIGAQRLQGVTIMGGCGAVICEDGSCPEIADCIFRDNRCMAAEVGAKGAGMVCHANSQPTILDCIFFHNDADGGGGLYCTNSSPTLTNVVFLENDGSGGGGMLAEGGGKPMLTGCLFSANYAGSLFGSRYGGGGMCCRSSADIVNCTFRDNVCHTHPGGGIGYFPESDSDQLSVIGCTFMNNRVEADGFYGAGGGMAAWDVRGSIPSLTVSNCTFVGNGTYHSPCPGGGIAFLGTVNAILENTIIAFSDSGAAIGCDGPNPPVLNCCDIYGNVGGDWVDCIADQQGINGNFSACPSFCNAPEGDFHLCDESPCAPGNHPDGYDCGLIGAWDVGCSCGPTPTELTTWGSIKAMYR